MTQKATLDHFTTSTPEESSSLALFVWVGRRLGWAHLFGLGLWLRGLSVALLRLAGANLDPGTNELGDLDTVEHRKEHDRSGEDEGRVGSFLDAEDGVADDGERQDADFQRLVGLEVHVLPATC